MTDLSYDWAEQPAVEESGAILVRPDKHIAWRAAAMPDDPHAVLGGALSRLLGRGSSA